MQKVFMCDLESDDAALIGWKLNPPSVNTFTGYRDESDPAEFNMMLI